MDEFRRITPEEEQQYRKKKTLLSAIVVCGILIIILFFIMLFLQSKDAKTFKLFINNNQVQVSNNFIITVDDEVYIAAEEFATLLGYKYQKGSYGSFSQNADGAYIQNDYEVASFTIDSNELKKYIKVDSQLDSKYTGITVLSENGYCETTTLEAPIIQNNGITYIPLQCIDDICNASSSMENNTLNVYDLTFLIDLARTKAPEYKCDLISGDYENLRALAYGVIVVIDNDSYGVVGLYDKNAFNIPAKYDKIVFNQNVKEFLVSQGNKVGILNLKGESVIDIDNNYEDISVLSDRLGLYLVSEDDKYGVLNRDGKEIVYAEYDSVGIDQDTLQEFSIKTDDLIYIPYDTMIVAEDSGKFGIYDIEDGEKLGTNYTGIGCIPVNLDRNYVEDPNSEVKIEKRDDAEKVLLIDIELEDGTGIKGIVLKQFSATLGGDRYGIYDSITGRLIIPCACTQIYSRTKNGRTTYYMEFNGEELELVEYLEDHPELNLEKYDGSSSDTDVEEK